MTHIDELVKRARSVADHAFSGTPQFVAELADAIESQSAELTRIRERNAELERDKSLDDRFAADQRAAKAIFAETGRTSGFPSVKEVVAYLISENERLETRVAELEQVSAEVCDKCGWAMKFPGEKCRNCEHDDLNAKLERAKAALREIDSYDVSAQASMVNQVFRLKNMARVRASQTQQSDSQASDAAHDEGCGDTQTPKDTSGDAS